MWIGGALSWAKRLVARITGDGKASFIKAGIGSTVSITVRDITITQHGAYSQPLPADAIVARHVFFEKKLIVGTQAGRREIYLPSRVYDQQIACAESVLTAFYENGVLAPLEDDQSF